MHRKKMNYFDILVQSVFLVIVVATLHCSWCCKCLTVHHQWNLRIATEQFNLEQTKIKSPTTQGCEDIHQRVSKNNQTE